MRGNEITTLGKLGTFSRYFFAYTTSSLLFRRVPNRAFLAGFGDKSSAFGRAMLRKIPMARPNEPDIPPKRTKKYEDKQ